MSSAERPLLLGCIADDFTGATDLANNLVRTGMRVVQAIGVPMHPLPDGTDAVVVALKSRTIAPQDAVAQSLEALHWLKGAGVRQIYLKYCSTFDSTPTGNIGPVIDALMDELGCDFTVATPAFPDNGRTIFKGYLFVGDVLLSESGMRDHPLTPMTDANLVRVLQAQTRRKVGLIDHAVVAQSSEAIANRIAALRTQGVSIAIVDGVSNEDLIRLGPAVADLALVTAGSGLAIGLAKNFGLEASAEASALPPPRGSRAIVSGSCSQATNRQVAHFISTGGPAFAIDPLDKAAGHDAVAKALEWVESRLNDGPVLVYSTAPPDAVRTVQADLGVEASGAAIEQTISRIAHGLVERGVAQLIVAGGETSGACVQALGIEQLQIGPQIDPGVPWCYAPSHGGLHIALKSGNFGSDDFFSKAFGMLEPSSLHQKGMK